MKSKTVLKEKHENENKERKEKKDVMSDDLKNLVDQHVRILKDIHDFQRKDGASNEDVRKFYNYATARLKIHERNRLRYIPQEFKNQTNSQNGSHGFNKYRAEMNIQRAKQKAENYKTYIEAETTGGERFDAAVEKKAGELLQQKDTELQLAYMEIEDLKKKNSSPANIKISFSWFDELAPMVTNFYKTRKSEGVMTIEDGKIVKLE